MPIELLASDHLYDSVWDNREHKGRDNNDVCDGAFGAVGKGVCLGNVVNGI